jgi:hypothetical protein
MGQTGERPIGLSNDDHLDVVGDQALARNAGHLKG